MHIAFARLVLFGLALILHAAPALAENRLALVVGNDSYERLPLDRQLHNAVNDAQAVADVLDKMHFKVTIKNNLRRSDFIDLLSDFSGTIGKGDIVFFFFAGHGVALEGANYLLPTDISMPQGGGESEEARLKEKAIAESRIVEWLKKRGAGASVTVVVLDACRDNPLTPPGGRSLGGARGLEPPPLAEGLMSIYSAGVGESAWDRLNDADQNKNSLFTRVFIEVLKTPGLDLQGVARETRHRVAELARSAGKTQTPGYYEQIDGQIFLAGRGPSDRPPEVVEPPSYCARGEEYDGVARSEGLDALRAYVQRCGADGKYRDEAAHEFESRLFLAAAECIRRAPGCSFEGCVSIYERELPAGGRAQALRNQASEMAASKAACRPTSSPTTSFAPPVESPPSIGTGAPAYFVRPSWCARATGANPNENLICDDADLARLDIQMNELYRARLGELAGERRRAFERSGAAWIASRDASCFGAREERKSCLSTMLRQRVAALQGADASEPGGRSFARPAWCANARSATENLICDDAELSALDMRLNSLTQSRLASLAGARRAEFMRDSRSWLATRDQSCLGGSRAQRRNCLAELMRERISELKGY